MTDNIHFNDDGTAWWVRDPGEWTDYGSVLRDLDRPCDVCGGTGFKCSGPQGPYGSYDEWDCPVCIDGRHTFDIEVECVGKLVEVTNNGRFGLSCDGGCGKEYPWGSLTYRVSVIPGMVLPIVDGVDRNGERRIIVTTGGGKKTWLTAERNGPPSRINLPPAATPGMWAVKVKVKVAS